MFRSIIYILAVLMLSACGATGVKFGDHYAALPPTSADSSRLVIYRTAATTSYAGRGARVRSDGEHIGWVEYKGFLIFDLKPGKRTLTADMEGVPGVCRIEFDAAAANTYYFEVETRESNVYAGMFFGVLGQYAESGNSRCGGAFSVASRGEATAKRALQGLSLSRKDPNEPAIAP